MAWTEWGAAMGVFGTHTPGPSALAPLTEDPSGASRRFVEAVCSLEVERVLCHIMDGTRLAFGKRAGAVGRVEIRKFLVRGFSLLHSLHCAPAVIWTKGNLSVIEADMCCERLDGAFLSFPLTIVLRFSGPSISGIRVFTYEPEVVSQFLSPRN
ncbi:MAG TPA: hypothetical protein VKU01_17745 [Bryobacteraceae bacterium]|nr:hypothetical protein [Bryobacteraceae bacterium]